MVICLGWENFFKLEKEEVDIVIIVNIFVYIKDKVFYLWELKKGIKEGGKFFIVEFKKKKLFDFVEFL